MRYRLLTENELAEWIGRSVATLRSERTRPHKDPIPFTKIGGTIRYREDLVLKWLERHTYTSTFEEQEARTG